DLVGPGDAVDLLQLVHRHFVDVEPAGGVEEDPVQQRLLGMGDGVAANLDGRAGVLAVDRHVDLFAEDFELVDGGGSLQVGGDQERLFFFSFLGGGGGVGGGGRVVCALRRGR